MSDEIPMKGGAEYDGLTRWRRYLRFRPGQRKTIKNGYRRRCRRLAQIDLQMTLRGVRD